MDSDPYGFSSRDEVVCRCKTRAYAEPFLHLRCPSWPVLWQMLQFCLFFFSILCDNIKNLMNVQPFTCIWLHTAQDIHVG